MASSHSIWANTKAALDTTMATVVSLQAAFRLVLDILKACNKEQDTRRITVMIKVGIQEALVPAVATKRTQVAIVDAITNTRITTSILRLDMVASHSMEWAISKISEAAMVVCRIRMACHSSSSTSKAAKTTEDAKEVAAPVAMEAEAFLSFSNSSRVLLLRLSLDNSNSLLSEYKAKVE
jgi:hypothetical protein